MKIKTWAMTLRGLTAALGWCLVATVPVAPAHAAGECRDLDTTRWTADSSPSAQQCLADLALLLDLRSCKPDEALCRSLREWRDLPTGQRVALASAQVVAARDRLDKAMDTTGFGEAAPVLRSIDDFVLRLRDVTVEQVQDARGGPLATGAASAWDYDFTAHVVLEGRPGELRLVDLLNRECPVSPQRCTTALRGGAEVVLAVWRVRAVANELLRERREAFAAHVALLDERWNAYFASSRAQYPWELALNSVLFTRGRTVMGLVGPPTEQWSFLHPAVGLRYRSGAESRYDSALVLEIVGYQRWTWSGSTMSAPRGGALVAAWTDKNKRDRPALGFIWHMKDNYSIGVMHDSSGAGRKVSLVVSADLAKLFVDPKAARDKLLGR